MEDYNFNLLSNCYFQNPEVGMLKTQKDKAPFPAPQELIDHFNNTECPYLRWYMVNKKYKINDTKIWGRERLTTWKKSIMCLQEIELRGEVGFNRWNEDVSFSEERLD